MAGWRREEETSLSKRAVLVGIGCTAQACAGVGRENQGQANVKAVSEESWRNDKAGEVTMNIRVNPDGTVDYAKVQWLVNQHHARYKRYVENHCDHLVCQECRGAGGETEVIDEHGGPWMSCGFCEGTGLVTPWIRSMWLNMRRKEKLESK